MIGRLTAVASLGALAMCMAGCGHIQSIARLVRPAPLVKTTAIATAPAQQAPEAARERLYRQAVAAMDQRDYGLALDLLQLARSAGSDDARVLNGLGVVYDKLQRFDLSARYYDLAEKADPGSRIVEANRRYSQLLQGHGVGTGSETRLAQGPAAAPTHTADGVLLIGRPIRLLNATGAPDGVLAIAANLERAGWAGAGAIAVVVTSGAGRTSRAIDWIWLQPAMPMARALNIATAISRPFMRCARRARPARAGRCGSGR